MKKLFISLFLIFSVSPAFAQSEEAITVDACPTLRDVARVAMMYRQSGIDMSELVKYTTNLDDWSRVEVMRINKLAYDEPLIDDMDKKEILINEFADKIERACYKKSDI